MLSRKPLIIRVWLQWKWKVKLWVAQWCPTLCDPMDCNLPGSSVHGILQARVLEWVAISFSRTSSEPRDWIRVSCIAGRFFTLLLLLLLLLSRFSRVRLCATPWTAAHQAPLSTEFSRQEHWSGSPSPSLGDLPNLGTEPRSPTLQADSLPFELPRKHCPGGSDSLEGEGK